LLVKLVAVAGRDMLSVDVVDMLDLILAQDCAEYLQSDEEEEHCLLII
jgi:hypothetical protein